MTALGQLFTSELGLSSWFVGLLLLPSLSVLLIFSLRGVILWVAAHLGSVNDNLNLWRRVTRIVAIVASLVAVGMTWSAYGSVIKARASATGPRAAHHLPGVAAALAYVAILGVLLYGVQQAYKALTARVDSWGGRYDGLHVQDTVFFAGDAFPHFAQLGLRILRAAVSLFLLYLFVPLFLSAFPVTRSIAHQVMPLVFDPLWNVAAAIIEYVPRLVIVVLIVVMARWTLHGLSGFMKAVGAGEITLGNFDPDWADQTYSLLKILVALITILLIYPYLPGSSSGVFQGFSILIGALVTFGATTTTNNFFSGLVLTYTHAFREGDRVRIGDQVGDVLQIGMVVTKLRTLDNEHVSIANTEVLAEEIVNYSDATALGGLRLTVTVGIGYDTEWRDVYQLLIRAARSTDNVLEDPAPYVQQLSLDDFAVTYMLAAFAEDPKRKPGTLTELRQNIQDTFNEAGIEIMTPWVRAVRESLDPAMPARYLSDAPDSPVVRPAPEDVDQEDAE
jgi:small-conductance mechanosensitive channel